ncbi:MAG TPA: hypothetical protein QGF95_08040 [Candidatus Latescibacteria bacterium]|nr:hypothetical protein [Gemmatimonadaceae bacterium]MDP6015215.1 hypothetical protein [Candidatus Latescibacterota bacterium]HJP30489.1 hypothetical protein [Candidatus Latescibacterota bacterium]
MRCRTTSLATLLLAVPVFGQITLDADDLRIPIGARYSLTATSMRGGIAENGIDVGPAGADQPFDLSQVLEGDISPTHRRQRPGQCCGQPELG